jgi:hypothetical protein
MTENQFWTKLFESQYFLGKRKRAEHPFSISKKSKYERSPVETPKTKKNQKPLNKPIEIEPSMDLTQEEHSNHLSARDFKSSTSYKKKQELIQKFNNHSAALIEQMLSKDTEDNSQTSVHDFISINSRSKRENMQEPKKVISCDQIPLSERSKKFRESFSVLNEIDDLTEGHEKTNYVDSPVLPDHRKYFQKTIKKENEIESKTFKTNPVRLFRQRMKDYTPNLRSVISQSSNCFIELFGNPAQNKPHHVIDLDEIPLEEAKNILLSTFDTTNELLRHMWSALRIQDISKVKRLITPLERQQQKAIRINRDCRPVSGAVLPVLDTIKEALQKANQLLFETRTSRSETPHDIICL